MGLALLVAQCDRKKGRGGRETLRIPIMIKTFLWRCRITRDKFTRETRFLTISARTDERYSLVLDFCPRLLDACSVH